MGEMKDQRKDMQEAEIKTKGGCVLFVGKGKMNGDLYILLPTWPFLISFPTYAHPHCRSDTE